MFARLGSIFLEENAQENSNFLTQNFGKFCTAGSLGVRFVPKCLTWKF